MRRRRFIVGTIMFSSVLSGCLWIGGSDGSNDPPPAQTPDDSQSNILPVEQNVSVSDGSFTETDRSKPLEAEEFVDTYERILRSKELRIEWEAEVRGETIVVVYSADDTDHEQHMKLFTDAFVELTYRAGGTGRDMRFVVSRSGEVWYEWELTDDLAREYLHGEISRNELLTAVNETVEPLDGSDESRLKTEPESDPPSDTDDDDADEDKDEDKDEDEGGNEDKDEDGDDDSDTSPDSGSDSEFAVRIRYDKEWSGVVGGDERSRSVDGSGTETFAIEDEHPIVITANAQKLDGGSGTLTIQIVADGAVVKETSTDAEYGVASVSYTP